MLERINVNLDGTSSICELKEFVIENCVIRSSNERLISRKGGSSLHWLIDLRPALLSPAMLEIIALEFWRINHDKLPFQVAGLEVAAIPLVIAILLQGARSHYDVSGLIIRKDRKTHGRGRLVEGNYNGGQVIIVDDIFNSGSSARKAFTALRSIDCNVICVFSVIDYESASGRKWLSGNNLASQTLFSLKEFGLTLSNQHTKALEDRHRVLWHHKSNDGHPFSVVPKSAPNYHSGMVVYGTDKGNVVCLDAANGKVNWIVNLPNTGRKGIWSSVLIHQDRIYVGAYNGNVYCLSLLTGNEHWCHHGCEWIGSSPICVPELGLLYIGFEYERPVNKGSIVALNMADGSKCWEHPLREYQHGSSVYFPGDSSIITGTNDHNVISLDAKTGFHKWTFETSRSVKYAPSIDEKRGLVGFASWDKSIYVLDAFTGQKKFEIETEDLCYTSPLFTENRLFCGSGDRRMYVVDLDTFTPVGRIDLRSRVYAKPRIFKGELVIGTTGGLLYFINPLTLEVIEKIQLPDAVTNGIAIGPDNRFYVTTYMNDVFGLERVLV